MREGFCFALTEDLCRGFRSGFEVVAIIGVGFRRALRISYRLRFSTERLAVLVLSRCRLGIGLTIVIAFDGLIFVAIFELIVLSVALMAGTFVEFPRLATRLDRALALIDALQLLVFLALAIAPAATATATPTPALLAAFLISGLPVTAGNLAVTDRLPALADWSRRSTAILRLRLLLAAILTTMLLPTLRGLIAPRLVAVLLVVPIPIIAVAIIRASIVIAI